MISFTGRGFILLIFSIPLMVSNRAINILNSILFIIVAFIEFMREFLEVNILSDNKELFINNKNDVEMEEQVKY